MDDKLIQALFALLRSALHGKPMFGQEKALYDPEQLPVLYKVSQSHDIAQIVGQALEINGLSDELRIFEAQRYSALFRYEQLNYVENEIFAALETAKIPFLPLKGTVIREHYPQPWMRTSCDVDVLVPEAQLEAATDFLVQHCGYSRQAKSSHDVNLLSPGQQHIELHYTLIEDDHVGSRVLADVWNDVTLRDGYQYWYTMSDALFYYYHIAHMTKHFELGGCGIRPLIDLWLLDRQPHDKKARDVLLARGELLQFAEAARRLSHVWLDGAKPDELCLQMQNYILYGGVYGTRENLVKVSRVKKGGKGSYILSRIFLRYDVLKYQYPVLERHKWLMPLCQVRRWCRLAFGEGLKHAAWEFSHNQEIRAEQMDETKAFLTQLGLL